MKNNPLLMLALLAAPVLYAQTTPAVNQADTTRLQRATDQVLREGDTVPALYEDENADIGPQSVLRAKKPTHFRANLDAAAYYTDNMFYADKDKAGAILNVTSLEAAFTTAPCVTRFASYRAELGYRHQFFNYSGLDKLENQGGLQAKDFDFNASTAFLNVLAQTKHYQFSAGLDYTRLLGFTPVQNHDYEEFYSEWVPRWSVQRNFKVCEQSMVSLAYLGSYHLTSEATSLQATDLNGDPVTISGLARHRSERWEHTFLGAWTIALPHRFVAQPFYRFQYNDFVNAEGAYMIHTVGLSAGWYPCANFAVRGYAGYNWSAATQSKAVEYTKLDIGAGLSATLRF